MKQQHRRVSYRNSVIKSDCSTLSRQQGTKRRVIGDLVRISLKSNFKLRSLKKAGDGEERVSYDDGGMAHRRKRAYGKGFLGSNQTWDSGRVSYSEIGYCSTQT